MNLQMFSFYFSYYLFLCYFYLYICFIYFFYLFIKVIQGVLCAILGTALDINKEHQQSKANKANNLIVALNIILAAVNIVISVFEGKGEIPWENSTQSPTSATTFT